MTEAGLGLNDSKPDIEDWVATEGICYTVHRGAGTNHSSSRIRGSGREFPLRSRDQLEAQGRAKHERAARQAVAQFSLFP